MGTSFSHSALYTSMCLALLMVPRIDPDEEPTRVFTKCQRLLRTKEEVDRKTGKKRLAILFFCCGREEQICCPSKLSDLPFVTLFT